MKSREIEFRGKKIHMAYCAATEQSFENITGKSSDVFFADKGGKVKATFGDFTSLAIAGIITYYAYKGEDAPIKDSEILFEATPSQRAALHDAILDLRFDWYEIPESLRRKVEEEHQQDEEEDSEKN